MMDAVHRVYADDSELLARIGRCLFGQELRLTVRLPRDLAQSAQAAWERDETGSIHAETAAERALRNDAGHLALIGLAVEERSTAAGSDVEVSLDAWQIGLALEAAERRDLLNGVKPPNVD